MNVLPIDYFFIFSHNDLLFFQYAAAKKEALRNNLNAFLSQQIIPIFCLSSVHRYNLHFLKKSKFFPTAISTTQNHFICLVVPPPVPPPGECTIVYNWLLLSKLVAKLTIIIHGLPLLTGIVWFESCCDHSKNPCKSRVLSFFPGANTPTVPQPPFCTRSAERFCTKRCVFYFCWSALPVYLSLEKYIVVFACDSLCLTIPQPHPNRSEGFIECLHPVGAVPAHGFGHVGVFIQCKRRGEMPHVLLHRFHIIAGPPGGNRIRVPQIVKTMMLQQRTLHQLVE